MSNNDFMINIIAALNKQLSAKSIQGDLKTLDNKFYIKILAKLSKTLATKELQNQLKELNNLYVQVGANVKIDKDAKSKLEQNIKLLQSRISDLEIGLSASKTQQAKLNSDITGIRKRLQSKINSEPLEFNMELKKQKLISDIEYLGKRYSKLFSNTSASQKYENLMSNALSITEKNQLADTRTELAAFTSELKANGLASKSTGDKWRALVDRSKDLFSAAATVRVVFSQMRQAISSTLELDTAMTDLYKVQNDVTSREQFSGMLTKWNKLAQGLSVTTESLINSASEWSKIGFGLDMSEQLAQITAIFEKTAEISNEQASKTLISGAQVFTEIDDLGEEDYVKRVEAIGNKINAIGNKYAISSEGISEALQNSSAALKMANNDLDESIALITAGNKIFQSPEEMGNTLKVVSARLRGQKGELEALNEDTEGLIEGVSKVQTQILNLTGNKVNIFESDNESLKSTYDIMLEVGKVLDSLSDKDSASLLEIMFGKQRMSAGSSLLLNYEELEKVKNDSMNAPNSMAEEYSKYMESAEAHITTLKEKLVETYQSFMNGDTIKYVTDFGTAMLDILNYTDLLRHGLLAIASIKIGQGISTIGLSIADAAKQVNILGGALQRVKSLPLDSVLRKTALSEIGVATKGLTDKNLKLLLSQEQLVKSDKIRILKQHDLSKKEAEAKLIKMGLITTTNAQTTANTANTTSTFTLSGALTTLKASAIGAGQAIKTAFWSNPIGFVLMGATTAFSILSTFISDHNQKLEETRQKAIELTNAYKDQQTSLKSQIEKYKELKEQLDFENLSTNESRSIKEQLLEIQESLIESYGNEASNIDLVNGKYKEQLRLLDDLSKEKANDYIKKQYSAFQDAKKTLDKEKTFNLGKLFSYNSEDGMSDAQRQLYDYIKGYNQLFDIRRMYNTSSIDNSDFSPTLFIKGNSEDTKSIINEFIDDIKEYVKSNNLDIDLEPIEIGISDALTSIDTDETLKNARSVYDEYIKAQVIANDMLRPLYQESIQVVEGYNAALSTGEGIKEAKASLDSVQQSVANATGELEGYQDVFDDIYNGINKDAEAAYNLGQAFENDDSVKGYAEQLKGLSDVDLKAINFDNDITEYGEEAFKNLMNTLGLTEDQVQMLIDKLVELGYVQEEVQSSISNTKSPIPYKTLTKSADSVTDAVSNLRSAISTLNDAFAEQSENGSVSVDTMLKLVESGYATALQFDATTGACTINKEAMLDLAEAKIQNQIADLRILQSDISTKLKDDGLIARESADDFIRLAKAKATSATAEQLASVQDYNEATAQIIALENSLKNIDKIGSGKYSTAKKSNSSSKSSSDPLRDAFTQEYNTLKHNLEMEYITEKEYYDKLSELNNKYFAGKSAYLDEYRKYEEEVYKGLKSFYKDYVDKQIDFLDAQLDAGIINYNHYSSTVKSIIENMYRDAKISSADYHSYIENLLKKQLTIYQSALKGVTTLIDDEIDKWQKKIDAVNDSNDALEDQLDGYNGILSAVDDVYQTEIDNLNKQKEAIQDKINGLQDEADAYDLLKRKEDALYALEQARQQRTKKVFVEGKGYIYTKDTDAVKDAQENLKDIQNEEIIRQLEDEQSKLDDCIGVLEEYRKKWAEISSAKETETNKQLAVSLWGQEYAKLILQNRLKDIDDFKNNYLGIQYQIDDNTSLIESYNQKIEYYNSLKDQWTSISDARENEMNRQYASQLLGAGWESDVLTGRIDTLNQFKNQYIALQQAIADASWKSANEQIKAAKEAERASQGTMGNAASVGQSGNIFMAKEEASQMWYVVDAKDQSLKISRGYASQDEAVSHLTDFAYRKNGVTIKKFHDGLKNGLVSSVKKDEDFSLVQKFGLKEYEVPTILKRGEGVLNSDQISNLAAALRYVPIQPNITKPDYSFLSNTCNNKGNSVSVTIGDINLHEVQKARDIAKEIERELPNAMLQALHIR